MAQAQIWRAQVTVADASQLAGWQQAIAQMPEAVRAGPYFLLGQAWARQGQSDKAALALLRVPLVYPENRALAARSLLEAGRCLADAGRRDEAAGLYREALEKYPETSAAADARTRLDHLK